MFKILFLSLLLWCEIRCFYIPGVALRELSKGENLEIKAVKMTSIHTQIPYDYYTLPFCEPKDKKYVPENLGEILRGDRIVNTPYHVKMKVEEHCVKLCTAKFKVKDLETLKTRIDEGYSIHMIIDNLPSVEKLTYADGTEQYSHGWQIGLNVKNNYYINNHLKFVLLYHQDAATKMYRVVGFEAYPLSVEKVITEDATKSMCMFAKDQTPFLINTKSDTEITFSYEVTWKVSNICWASRWDNYLKMRDVQIHWFAIINSIVIVLFLSGFIKFSSISAVILVRTLRRDIANYSKDNDMESMEETGWKLVHGDVFRAPRYPMLLAAFVGSGVQLFCMVLVTIVFAMFGMLSPASRGGLVTAIIFLYVFMGLVAGFYSGRLYRTLKGQTWKRAALMTGVIYPCFVCSITFMLNLLLWHMNSSGAIPFTTMLALFCLWFGISVPLVYLGYFFGFRKAPYAHPVRTNQIPRQIPTGVWYMHPSIRTAFSGILPFGAVFIELFFILSAIWENKIYYLFGFLFLVFIILCVCCSEIAIVMTYFQLCEEDYRWWWSSFFMSGSCAFYLFLYSVFYYMTKLKIVSIVSALMYFGYSFIMVFSFWIITGTVGFFSTYFFVNKIYSSVKID